MNENRANVIRNVLGIVGNVANNRNSVANNRNQPIQPARPEQAPTKTDYTPFIIAGAFTIISALIISRSR